MSGLLDEGTLTLPLLVAVSLLVGFFAERQLQQRGTPWYFLLGFPLVTTLVPLAGHIDPRPTGSAGGYRWAMAEPGLLFFWSNQDDRRTPSLLHGAIHLVATRGQTLLHVRWAPPLTPLVGCGWLIALGLARGEGAITVPIGAAMLAALVWLYLRGAHDAAALIRYALQPDAPDDLTG